jgi:hypothetical protein
LKLGNFKGRYQNYELLDVPERSAIESHGGNTQEDLLGCIALGRHFRIDEQWGKYWITDSKRTFDEFMAAAVANAITPEHLIMIMHIANQISTPEAGTIVLGYIFLRGKEAKRKAGEI